jgi:hypothetical protein
MRYFCVYNWEGKDTSKILMWVCLGKRPHSRPKKTQKDDIVRDIMELICVLW